jgi:WD40 repeat protein
MLYKKIAFLLFIVCMSSIKRLNTMEAEHKKNLQKFFDERIDYTCTCKCTDTCTCGLAKTILPDIVQCIFPYWFKYQPKWQPNNSLLNYSGQKINNIDVSPHEDYLAFAMNKGRHVITNIHLQAIVQEQLSDFNILSTKIYNSDSSILSLCSITGDRNTGKKSTILLRDITITPKEGQYDVSVKNVVEISHGYCARAIALDVQNKTIITGADDNNVCIWNCKGEDGSFVLQPKLLFSIPCGGAICKIDLVNDGTKLAVISLDGIVRVFDSKYGNLLCIAPHAMTGICFAHITADGSKIIHHATANEIYITDIATKKSVTILSLSDIISTIYITSDDTCVVAGATNGNVKIWDISNISNKDKKLFEYKIDDDACINHISFNKSNNLLVMSCWKHPASFYHPRIYIYDIVTNIWNTAYFSIRTPIMSHALLHGKYLLAVSNNGCASALQQYTCDQIMIRKLFFLWLLVKRIPLSIKITVFVNDICTTMKLDYKILWGVWRSLHGTERDNIWKKCCEIMGAREEEYNRVVKKKEISKKNKKYTRKRRRYTK